MLQLEDITAGYGDAPLFSGLSLSVARGEMQLIPEGIASEMGRLAREGRNIEHFEGMKRLVEAKEPDFAN